MDRPHRGEQSVGEHEALSEFDASPSADTLRLPSVGSREVLTGSIAAGRRGTTAVFLTTAFVVTWAIWAPLVVRARSSGLDHLPWYYFVASIGPLCGAVAAEAWGGGLPRLASWARRTFAVRIEPKWWIAALGMPLGYLLASWATARIVTGAWPDAASFGLTEKLPGIAWPLVALIWAATFGLGEESGWRGWLLPALHERMSVFWAALVVAGAWITWHAPAFFFNPTYVGMGAGIVGWMLALACGSYVLAWMTVGAQWSIVPVLLWHAGFDLVTAADQSAGVIASTASAIVMMQGAWCAWVTWHQRRTEERGAARNDETASLRRTPKAHKAARL